MPKLTAEAMKAFLEEPGHLVRIGTVDTSGQPWVLPAWFIAKDERLYVTLRGQTRFWENLVHNPKASFLIDEYARPARKVVVNGEVELVHDVGHDDEWRDLYREITERYTTPERAAAYLAATKSVLRRLIALPLAGSQVTTWRLPLGGEDPAGIFAKRYWRNS